MGAACLILFLTSAGNDSRGERLYALGTELWGLGSWVNTDKTPPR